MAMISKYVTKESIRRKNLQDKIVKNIFFSSTILSASFIILIVIFILVKGIAPFVSSKYISNVNLFDFLTGIKWLDGATGISTDYGVGFLIINTIIVVLISLLISIPVSILTGLFIAKIAPKRVREIFRTVVELLASIPSIIYGVFGLGVIAPVIMNIAEVLGFQSSGGLSLITTSIVLGMMTIPTITVISENSIRSVDKILEEGSLALGASPTQTQLKVLIPAAKSGIFAGIILGIGRALGEATAVSMVSGNRFSGLVFNPFDTTSTLTSRMLLGIKETTGIDYDIRFSVGLVLMLVIILANIILKVIMKKVGNLDDN